MSRQAPNREVDSPSQALVERARFRFRRGSPAARSANAPGLFNVAARRYLMWDARVDGSDLATAVRDMITEAHTHTMNMDTRLAQEPLKQVPEYVSMFEAAFGPGDPYGGKIYSAAASASVQASTSPALPQLSHRLRPLPVGSAGRHRISSRRPA